MPRGTPPNGLDVSADEAAARARSSSTWTKALSSLASMAARVASSSSSGDRSLARKASTSEQASPSQGASVMVADRRRESGGVLDGHALLGDREHEPPDPGLVLGVVPVDEEVVDRGEVGHHREVPRALVDAEVRADAVVGDLGDDP